MKSCTLPVHIDSTMRSAFVGCGQKFHLEFDGGFRPKQKSIHLHAGGCFATALEETYKQIWVNNRKLDDALVFAHAAYMQAWGDFDLPDWKHTAKTKDRVWECVAGNHSWEGTPSDPENRGYFEVYSPHTDDVQPYFDASGKPTFEYTFAIPLEPVIDLKANGTYYIPEDYFPLHPSGQPFIYCGRFDQLGSRFGTPVIKDDKTLNVTPPANWSESWDLRSQFIGYVWACQQCGIPVDTVVVRGIGILKTKIAHTEAVKTYDRFIINRWHEQLRRDLWRIRRSYDEGYWDYDLGEQCNSYGGCMFRQVCGSVNPEAWLQEFQISHWNPLLKDPSNVKSP